MARIPRPGDRDFDDDYDVTYVPGGGTERVYRGPGSPSAQPTPSQVPITELSSARDLVNEYLARWGIEDFDAWDLVTSDMSSGQILDTIRESDAHRRRFAGLHRLRDAGVEVFGAGLNEAQYLSNEAEYRANLGTLIDLIPDTQDLYATLFANQVSPLEMAEIIDEDYRLLTEETDPLVRMAYDEMFGGRGDDVLLVQMLTDADADEVRRRVRQAAFGGFGREQGFRLTREETRALTTQPFTRGQIESAVSAAGRFRGLLGSSRVQSASVTAQDIIGSRLGMNNGQQQLDRALRERRSEFGGGGRTVGSRGAFSGFNRLTV